jgi:predicted metal-binding protein
MPRIGILTCSNATQDLGCSSASCLSDLRKRKGQFALHPADQPLDLAGIINCPGCPTAIGPVKLLQRVRALTEFRIDAIHFSYCIKALCPFKEQYQKALHDAFPAVRIIPGTHQEHIPPNEFRDRVNKLFCQPRKTMTDLILKRDE